MVCSDDDALVSDTRDLFVFPHREGTIPNLFLSIAHAVILVGKLFPAKMPGRMEL
jgi:hypothetical protein